MHYRTLRTLAAGLSLSLLVPVMGISGPGDGIAVGDWLLHPSLKADATFDSNVYKTDEDTTSDTFLTPEVSISVASPDDISIWAVEAAAFLSRREYLSEDDLSFTTYGDTIRVEYGERDRWQFGVLQSYRKLTDDDSHAVDLTLTGMSDVSPAVIEDIHVLSAERGINQLAATLDVPVSDKVVLGLGAGFSSVAYEGDNDAKSEFDTEGYLGRVRGRYLATDHTSVFLDVWYGIQTQEDLDDQAESLASRIGIELFGTDKLTYNVGLGVLGYALPDESSESAFSFDVSAKYLATEKIVIVCGANNGSQLSALYAANGVDYVSGWASAAYSFRPTTVFSLRATYRHDEYINPVNVGGSPVDRNDDRVEGAARVDYKTPADWMKVYGQASYAVVDSSVDGLNYDDVRAVLGVDLCY